MSIYHLSVKPISRSSGRSATAASAYRCAALVHDERTGLRFDFRKKRGVIATQILAPAGAPGWALDRAKLWNAVELAEARKDSCVAREYEVALPYELTNEQRFALVQRYAGELVEIDGCAIEFSIHAPAKNRDGESKNWHVHILRTTRHMTPQGLSDKLESEKAGRNRKADLASIRAHWASVCNAALKEAGIDQHIDHRSHSERGLSDLPTIKVGHGHGVALRRMHNSQIVLINTRMRDLLKERRRAHSEMVLRQQSKISQQKGMEAMRLELARVIRAKLDSTIRPGLTLPKLRNELSPLGVELIEDELDYLRWRVEGEDLADIGIGYTRAALVARGLILNGGVQTGANLDSLARPKTHALTMADSTKVFDGLADVIAQAVEDLRIAIVRLINKILTLFGVTYRLNDDPIQYPRPQPSQMLTVRPVQELLQSVLAVVQAIETGRIGELNSRLPVAFAPDIDALRIALEFDLRRDYGRLLALRQKTLSEKRAVSMDIGPGGRLTAIQKRDALRAFDKRLEQIESDGRAVQARLHVLSPNEFSSPDDDDLGYEDGCSQEQHRPRPE